MLHIERRQLQAVMFRGHGDDRIWSVDALGSMEMAHHCTERLAMS